jgi:serine/threonine-protein kinase RsbW
MSEPAVQIETPAAGEYLAVVRAAATGLAAGLDFTYEQIDDLRIAVDEACAQLIAHRAGASTLRVAYSVETAALRVEVTVDGAGGGEPPDPLPRDTFSWQILGAVVDEIDERIDAGELLLAFRKRGGTP